MAQDSSVAVSEHPDDIVTLSPERSEDNFGEHVKLQTEGLQQEQVTKKKRKKKVVRSVEAKRKRLKIWRLKQAKKRKDKDIRIVVCK